MAPKGLEGGEGVSRKSKDQVMQTTVFTTTL